MTPGLAGLAGTPKRRVSFVLIFRSYDLEELEAAIRWLRASASRTLVCSREVPRGSEAAQPLPACPLTCTQARERELQMAKASAGHGPAAPAGEAGGGARPRLPVPQPQAVAGWGQGGDHATRVEARWPLSPPGRPARLRGSRLRAGGFPAGGGPRPLARAQPRLRLDLG